VAENRWEDKLTILHWDEQLASREGVQLACSSHVEELVIHWMTTGSLDYPFARTALGLGNWRRRVGPGSRVDVGGARRIIELAVHRESMERLLTESPQSLQVMLDALQEALQRESRDAADLVSEPAEERGEEAGTLSLKPGWGAGPAQERLRIGPPAHFLTCTPAACSTQRRQLPKTKASFYAPA
jgi:hypothetical protein